MRPNESLSGMATATVGKLIPFRRDCWKALAGLAWLFFVESLPGGVAHPVPAMAVRAEAATGANPGASYDP